MSKSFLATSALASSLRFIWGRPQRPPDCLLEHPRGVRGLHPRRQVADLAAFLDVFVDTIKVRLRELRGERKAGRECCTVSTGALESCRLNLTSNVSPEVSGCATNR